MQLGAKFRRQYSVDDYVLDFYAPRVKLAVEVDGDSHFGKAGMAHDRERTAHLQSFGIEVLRFTNLEIRENLDGVLARIDEVLQRRRGTSP
jgi:very-short-patch-repair endonuclease